MNVSHTSVHPVCLISVPVYPGFVQSMWLRCGAPRGVVAKLLASRARDRNSSVSCCCHLPCIVDKYFHSLAEMLSLVVRSVEFDAVLTDLNQADIRICQYQHLTLFLIQNYLNIMNFLQVKNGLTEYVNYNILSNFK